MIKISLESIYKRYFMKKTMTQFLSELDEIEINQGICDQTTSKNNITNLTKLHICNYDDLIELPNSFWLLKELKLLTISCCYDLEEIPKDIRNLTKLEEIDFFGIESLKLSPEVFKLPNLKKLFMSINLSQMPNLIWNLPKLEHLKLNGCHNFDTSILSKLITNLSNLKIIELLYLEDIDDELLQTLTLLPNLEVLRIDDCYELPKSLYDNKNLKIFHEEVECENSYYDKDMCIIDGDNEYSDD